MRFTLITMWSRISYRIRSISLIWKLLIPFLAFAFIGTTSLVYLGLNSQQTLINQESARHMKQLYRLFLYNTHQKAHTVLAMASVIAEDPEIKRLMARQDRKALERYATPIFKVLKKKFGIEQFHFHLPPGRSFLRLHREEEQGEMMPFRRTVVEAMRSRNGVSGLEWGRSGLGIRGVAPILQDGRLLGSVEIGFPFDIRLLNELKREWRADFGIYEKRGKGSYFLLTCTDRNCTQFSPGHYFEGKKSAGPVIMVAPESLPDRSVLLGPLKDYQGDVVAVVLIALERSNAIGRMEERRNLMLFIAITGVIVSFCLTWLVAIRFVKPIKEIVKEAQEIAEGKRESRLQSRPDDEIGSLTKSLNAMLGALKERRKKIEEYAQILEDKVRGRTADLVASEEKYRTFAENVPLIVYRVLVDGTTEFINPYFTDKLGFTPDEVVGDRHFWREKICGQEDSERGNILEVCWGREREFRVERMVKTRNGKTLTFIDQAIPSVDNQGTVRWIDGIMMDITELKIYQERALQTEEIRVLGEISARLAHEIRNPLTIAGGFARRVAEKLPEGDPNRKAASIIVEEVGKLEEILRMILQSIEPMTIHVGELNISVLVDSLLNEHMPELVSRNIKLMKTIPDNLPPIEGDEDLLSRALDSLIQHSMLSTPEGNSFSVAVQREEDSIVIILRHFSEGISEEDLEQFFLPRVPLKSLPRVLDLPLSRIIVNKHGGRIDVLRDGQNAIIVKVALPVSSAVFQG
jgi:PAS domain S-box-containing protein